MCHTFSHERGSIDHVSVSIKRLSPAEFSLITPRLVDLHLQAMDYSPDLHSSRVRAWRHDTMKRGFNAVIATGPNDVVGVAYGFLSSPDHWWDRQLRRGLKDQNVDESTQIEVRSGYFEVAEIHVRPGLQGRGIGRALLSELLWNAPARRALLSTPEVPGEANGAFALYRSFGFTDVLRDFRYPSDVRPFAVLKVDLPIVSPS